VSGHPQVSAPAPPRVLILRALGLGDFLTGVPAYRALRAAYPGHEIVLAAPAGLAPLAALTGAVDRVLATGELEPVPWRGPPPAVAADLHGNGPASHDLVRAVGAPVAMMYASPADPSVAGPWWTEEEHEVDRWCRLLGWWGIPADPGALRLSRPRTRPPAAAAAVVHPGAASGSRRWPAERFAAVARMLSDWGLPVVISGNTAERPLADRVAQAAGLSPASVLAGRTGLAGLAAVVAAASMVISNDTGIAHLAVAYGTPSITLFGPVSPALWGPPRDSPRHLVLWKGSGARPGDAHGARPDPRLLRIEIGEVLEAAGRLSRRTGGRPSDAAVPRATGARPRRAEGSPGGHAAPMAGPPLPGPPRPRWPGPSAPT
jgi:ADP-heptose:LPS heptosyltransferase